MLQSLSALKLSPMSVYPEPWSEQTTTITVHRTAPLWIRRGIGRRALPPLAHGKHPARNQRRLVAMAGGPHLPSFAFWFVTKTASHYSRVTSLAWFALTPLFLCTVRVGVRGVLRLLRVQGRNIRRVAILGCTKDAERLAESFEAMPWLGLKLVGRLRRPVRGQTACLQSPGIGR
jgi:hypothetical protein